MLHQVFFTILAVFSLHWSFSLEVPSSETSYDSTPKNDGDYLALRLNTSDIHLIDTPQKFVQTVDHISENYNVVAMGAEWKPNLAIFKDEPALFQFAVWNAVYLLDIAALKNSNDEPICNYMLEKIFNNKDILKLGYDAEDMLKSLMEAMGCEKEEKHRYPHLIDLEAFFKKVKAHYPKVIAEIQTWHPLTSSDTMKLKGLSLLSRVLLGKPLSTEEQFSNWESRPLTESQIKHAASEAYTLLMMYEKIDPLLKNLQLDLERILQSSCTPCYIENIKESSGETLEDISSYTIEKDTIGSSAPNKEEWYPSYHLAPPEGWMNDPNGLIYFDNYYHAFYQHNPDAPVWGPMHWGHARSKDMIEWEHLPIALAPSIDEDKDGCFSGSAVDNGGVLTLIYTGHVVVGDKQYQQVTCIATSNDTINFTKHGKVLDPPTGVHDFRDPKVWREDDKWYMVMGTRDGDLGEAHLYVSDDLLEWRFEDVLAKADQELGYMWECPDFFPLGDKHLLMMSPQGMHPKDYQYRNLYQSGYFKGSWKSGDRFDIEGEFIEIDHGHDFYAPQSFLGLDNRRILIGWMDMWESPMPESKQDWAGMFSLPRELKLGDNDEVLVLPVPEVEEFRYNSTQLGATVLKDHYLQLDCNVKALEIIMNWNISSSSAEKYGLHLGNAEATDGGLFLYVDTQAQRLVLDRRYPQYQLSGYRSVPLPHDGLLSLRVFFDHSSVEVFVNDGKACLSSRIYPKKDERCLSLFAENGQATLQSSSRWLLGNNKGAV